MSEPLRVAYTLEQCWHDVPGGTAVASLEVARRLHTSEAVELVGVAGRHRRRPVEPYVPPVPPRQLPLARPWLYEAWNRWERPRVERVAGRIDVCHSTTAIPAATSSPHVVTVHDVAFALDPGKFTGHGVRIMTAGLARCRNADLIMCPSHGTASDLTDLGFDDSRIRVVPWGVEPVAVTRADIERVRRVHGLPERFVLFVGTVEPRKNLARLAQAVRRLDEPIDLVVAGAAGWGGARATAELAGGDSIAFLGFVPSDDLPVLYAAATVFAYPSETEGFGLPVAEAMAQGVPVVTSRASATAEVAGGAAVLVDPFDIDDITRGIADAVRDADELVGRGRSRAAELSWDETVDATIAVYREVAR